MFAATREATSASNRRRSRTYGVNKTARSSRLSLLSAFTTTSSGSGGSTSTVTQESYSRSRSNEVGKSGRKRKSRVSKMRDNIDTRQELQQGTDVFDFLVQDEGKQDVRQVGKQDVGNVDDSDPECYYRSHLSDSGISMSGSSTDGRDLHAHGRLYPLPEEYQPMPPFFQPPPPQYIPSGDRRWSWHGGIPGSMPPEELHETTTFSNYNVFAGRSRPRPQRQQSNTTVHSRCARSESPRDATVKMNGHPLPQLPAFRSFARITMRLLLQMQDDIADLELELTRLDDSEHQTAEHPGSPSTHSPSTHSPVTSDATSTRRIEIYQELHFRLGQYQNALLAHTKIDGNSRAADKHSISHHQKWLEAHISPASRIENLLGDDLRLFDGYNQQYQHFNDRSIHIVGYVTLFNGLLPLFLFKIFGSVLNRLILLMLITSIGMLTVRKTGLKLDKQHVTLGLALLSISLCAAVIL